MYDIQILFSFLNQLEKDAKYVAISITPEAYLNPSRTSAMELFFAKIAPSGIFEWVLNTPLHSSCSYFSKNALTSVNSSEGSDVISVKREHFYGVKFQIRSVTK